MKEAFAEADKKKREMNSNWSAIESDTLPSVPKFTLSSPGDFASRSKDVFGKLLCLERNHETWMSENAVETKDITRNSDAMETDVEVFKKPIPTRDWKSKQTSAPIFKRPTRIWKKYSLKDVPVASDAKNTAIALQCISELRKRKLSDDNKVDNSNKHSKIVFSKPLAKTGSSNKLKSEVAGDSKSPKVTLQHLQDQ